MTLTASKNSLAPERSVAILFDPEGTWSLQAIEGIAEYARSHAQWRLLCAPRDHQGRIRLPQGWKGDGLLARFLSARQRKDYLEYGIPIVDLETIVTAKYHKLVAHVVTDDSARAQMVLDYFQGLKVGRIACFNPPHQQYSANRVRSLQQQAIESGMRCELFWTASEASWHRLSWTQQQEKIKNWLRNLPAKTAVFTPDGRQGRLITEWCHFLQIRVPDDLIVLTGDDDSLLCSISSPPLSGVVLGARQHGYEAAAMLQRMMDGEPASAEPLCIKPLYIAIRESSDILKYKNQDVVQAIRFIRENAQNGISVADVLNHVPISRRALEQQFLLTVGHTLGQEIRKVRFQKAKMELANTNASISQVATACGFSTTSKFCSSFKKEYGETPLSYRKRSQIS